MPNKCFRCDGTGELCNICGESDLACQCEDGFDGYDCEDCNGSGE